MKRSIEKGDVVTWTSGVWSGRARTHTGVVVTGVPRGCNARDYLPDSEQWLTLKAKPIVRAHSRTLVEVVEDGSRVYYAPMPGLLSLALIPGGGS